MFKRLKGSVGNVLAVEISGEYTKADVEKFIKAFEKKLSYGHDQINVLVKLDKLKLSKIKPAAFVKDCRYALKNIKQLRHIAVVGNSKFEKAMVSVDNLLLGSKKKQRVEKYFNVRQIKKAWEFVRS